MTTTPEEKPSPLKFNFHAEREESFLHWMLLNIVTIETRSRKDGGKPGLTKRFEALSEATNHFENVELGITVNGIAVDAGAFVERLEEALERGIEREARRLVTRVAEFREFEDAVEALKAGLKEKIYRTAAELGIELDETDWRY